MADDIEPKMAPVDCPGDCPDRLPTRDGIFFCQHASQPRTCLYYYRAALVAKEQECERIKVERQAIGKARHEENLEWKKRERSLDIRYRDAAKASIHMVHAAAHGNYDARLEEERDKLRFALAMKEKKCAWLKEQVEKLYDRVEELRKELENTVLAIKGDETDDTIFELESMVKDRERDLRISEVKLEKAEVRCKELEVLREEVRAGKKTFIRFMDEVDPSGVRWGTYPNITLKHLNNALAERPGKTEDPGRNAAHDKEEK